MIASVEAFIGLGANLGHPACAVSDAMRALESSDIHVLASSRLYRTRAWGVTEQPDYVNAVARVRTSLQARDLLDALLALERDAGRDRRTAARWGPRELDLDLLLYGDLVIDTPGLTIPHPHMHERAFVLVPLLELAPDVVIPHRGSARQFLMEIGAADIEAIR